MYPCHASFIDQWALVMRWRLVFIFTVVLFIACAALFITLRSSIPSAPLPTTTTPVLTVRHTFASIQQWPEILHAVGSIAAWQEVIIGAEIGGKRLSRLLVNVGDRVEKGQLLAQLSTGTLEADLMASRAVLQEAEIDAAQARRAADRARMLQGTEALSEQSLDQALAVADTAHARLVAARARVQADLLRLTYTEVRAPDEGLISSISAVEGALVQTGAELMRLQRQGRLEWRAELPGPELVQVVPGQVVHLALGDSQIVEGRVRRVSPQVDPHTRTGIVYVDLESSARVRAGLFARGELLLTEHRVLTLPETAVLLRDGFSYVFLLDGSQVRQQKVTVGSRRDSKVEIREGIDADTPVVESGVGFLSDGVTIRLAAADPKSSSQPPH